MKTLKTLTYHFKKSLWNHWPNWPSWRILSAKIHMETHTHIEIKRYTTKGWLARALCGERCGIFKLCNKHVWVEIKSILFSLLEGGTKSRRKWQHKSESVEIKIQCKVKGRKRKLEATMWEESKSVAAGVIMEGQRTEQHRMTQSDKCAVRAWAERWKKAEQSSQDL